MRGVVDGPRQKELGQDAADDVARLPRTFPGRSSPAVPDRTLGRSEVEALSPLAASALAKRCCSW